MKTTLFWCGLLWALVLLVSGAIRAESQQEEDDDDDSAEFAMDMASAPSSMGATPGGAQDIEWARERIAAGEVPHPNTFTPEGLFSQHDLPLASRGKCSRVLCLSGAAAPATLLSQPEVRHLAQLGFSTNIQAKSWRRPPLYVVAVVDKSGSMSGEPLEAVKEALRQVILQMTSRDQLAIVLYGDRSHVHLPPTRLRAGGASRKSLLAAVDAMGSAGSTAMEAGLSWVSVWPTRGRAAFAAPPG